MREYEGKTAFVTGAAAGFGKAFSEALCARGAAVVLVGIDEQAVNREPRR